MLAGVATGNWNLKQADGLSRRGRMAPSETAGQATVFRGGPQFGTSSASWSEVAGRGPSQTPLMVLEVELGDWQRLGPAGD